MSLAAHLAFFVFLGFVPPPDEALAARPLEFEVYEPPPLPEIPPDEPEPEPPPEPEPEPEPAKPVPRTVRAPSPNEPPPPEPPPSEQPPGPAADETPFDFTGVTLTAEGTGGWSTAVGNGRAMTGPVGRPGARVTGRNVEGTAEEPAGPRVVAEADLSRRAVPPTNIAAALEQYYPNAARQQGIEGFATMRVRILPDGRVGRMTVKRESFAGFGAACRQALDGPRWTPPLDKQGQPVATDIEFTCRFEVER